MNTRRAAVASVIFGLVVAGATGLAFGQECPELVRRRPDGPVYAVATSGTTAYMGSGAALRVVNVDDPAQPTAQGAVFLPNVVKGIAVAGDYAYVADGSSGLRVIDVSSPAAPVEVGAYDTPGDVTAVAIADGSAFVADSSSGLRVIDVSNPAAPAGIGVYDTPGNALGVAVASGYAYVADGDAGLEVLTICSLVFQDTFESGDLAAWSAHVP